MIDYWESLGRLAYSKDLFSEFKKVLGDPTEYQLVTVTAGKITATGLNIPDEVYKRVQNFFQPLLTEQFVALSVAGELIWTFSYKDTRSAFEGIQELVTHSRSELHSPSTSYFIALGLILVDPVFRGEVAASKENRARLLPRLADPQRDEIGKLTNDPKFLKHVTDFEIIWDKGCDARLINWRGYVWQMTLNAPAGAYASAGPTHA